MVAAALAGCSKVEECEQRQLLSEAIAPTKTQVAFLYSNVCAAGLVTSASVTAEIRSFGAKPEGSPGDSVVFGMEDFGPISRQALQLHWQNATTLQITVPNEAFIGTQLTSFKGVSIRYVYVPDEPVIRDCLHKWLGTASAGNVSHWPAAKAECVRNHGTKSGA
jgi:hypothetical protein